jgi:hypothetical protein
MKWIWQGTRKVSHRTLACQGWAHQARKFIVCRQRTSRPPSRSLPALPEEPVKVLWTFEDKEKLDKFAAVLDAKEISYEVNAKSEDRSTNQHTLSVEDDEYEQAKRLLMRHRKRKTGK